MKPLVAVTGKGGTGKSTLTALLVQQLVASGVRPVLAVDADPNSCLGDLLGIEVPGTMAELRDRTRRSADETPGLSKPMQVDLGLNEIMSEGTGFDLLTMGQPEGSGCYCYINNLLKGWLEKTGRQYAIRVVDNQAGMEHLSRLVTATIDVMLIVAEPTLPAARAVARIMKLSRNLPMKVGRRVVVWNRVHENKVPQALRDAADENTADASVMVAWSDRLAAAYVNGEILSPNDLDLPGLVEIANICHSQNASSTA